MKGIIMSGNHPKLILDGIKTMTRKVIKPPSNMRKSDFDLSRGRADCSLSPKLHVPIKLKDESDWSDDRWWRIYCPYGQVGDRLWVRESFLDYPEKGCLYKADYDTKRIELSNDAFCVPRWKPSIHMPRWASRITLGITEVRVERLQDITEEDAMAEGCNFNDSYSFGRDYGAITYRELYHRLWDSLNTKRGYGWEVNPWVFVISFKVEGSA